MYILATATATATVRCFRRVCSAILVALIAMPMSSATAAILVENFVGEPVLSPSTDTRTDGGFQAGFGFYANGSGTAIVNELGFWVSPADSGNMGFLAVDHTITLYHYAYHNVPNEHDYTVIGQAVVAAGSTADVNGYAWTAIAPVHLSDTINNPGDYYIVTATQGTDTWGPTSGSNTWSSVHAYFGTPTGLGWFSAAPPVGLGGTQVFVEHPANGGYVGPNIGYVPEPSSAVMIGLGAVGLFIAARFRRKASC